MNIDWSKAPKGTEAASPETAGAYSAWYRRDVAGLVEQICEGAGITAWTWMGGRKDFPVGYVLRPSNESDGVTMKQPTEIFLTTCNDGIAHGIEHAIKHRTGIEAFGYRFEVAELERKSGFPSKARLVQVSGPEVPAWTGEGPPPAGMVCEVDGGPSGDGWGMCAIRYSSPDVIVFKRDEYGFESFASVGENSFRPIPTPEQIAAEERASGIRELVHFLETDRNLIADTDECIAAALWDAGYRKVPRE